MTKLLTDKYGVRGSNANFSWDDRPKSEGADGMSADFHFGTSSRAELKTVHPDLVKLSHRALALSEVDFRILQGWRSHADQLKAYLNGFSQIDPRKRPGRHMVRCAIDFAVFDPKTGKLDTLGKTKWSQKLYADVRAAYRAASKELKIPIRTLEHIGDLGHVELPRSYMPDDWQKK